MPINQTTVNTRPVKRFFVEMLTRDISLEDAILDLLDNCVDGILRSLAKKTTVKPSAKPYAGFHAYITVNGKEFSIRDNCGGIPWSAHERAFRMGRPSSLVGQADDPKNGVGVYGIGMKRAIFKLGRRASIRTQNGEDRYEVPFSEKWMMGDGAEDDWTLPVASFEEKFASDGTVISVTKLADGVSEVLDSKDFQSELMNKIRSQYAVIIGKGFEVHLNGMLAKPYPIELRFASKVEDGNTIRPYMFKSDSSDVDVFLAVGLREPIPDAEDLLEEQREPRNSSSQAGWTVICNDRVVLYCNRDELTGWGTADVPRYHTQFISISGVVEFRGDPSSLPTTTTKRGLNFSSALYQQVLNRMRDGTRMFTDFTNRWKTREEVARTYVEAVPSVSYTELRRRLERNPVNFNPVKIGLPGEQYKPSLPLPQKDPVDKRISYIRSLAAIWELADELFPDEEDIKEKTLARRVGEESFDYAYRELVANKIARERRGVGGKKTKV